MFRLWYLTTPLVMHYLSLFECVRSEGVNVELKPYEYRPPGTFLLNMLIKNEAVHLRRTLPRWAKVIDYWIIGVDDANTDESPEVIQKYLGHIPGEIVIVHFDGMGPTWSILVQHGIENYPNATHGIIADADYMPRNDYLNRRELDVRCSKHMYTIWTEDHTNERRMDWIYRNIPGARVTRRTHQIVSVPVLPKQEVFQTLIDLPIEERAGGYQDRTGNKNERYIGFLEADLAEYPGDTRTLYYLGYAHFDIFNSADKKTQWHWDHLETGIDYMNERISHTEGNEEELWFTILKLGEIYERFYGNWNLALERYLNCTKLDGERADAWFYLGQHYRLAGDMEKALEYLKIAADLPTPTRALFQWHFLYQCVADVEYGKAIKDFNAATKKQLKEAVKMLQEADCFRDKKANAEKKELIADFKLRIEKKSDDKIKPLKNLINWINKNADELESSLDQLGIWHILQTKVQEMQTCKDTLKKYKKKPQINQKLSDVGRSLCRPYRRATTPYLRFFNQHESSIETKISSELQKKWKQLNKSLRIMCR